MTEKVSFNHNEIQDNISNVKRMRESESSTL